MRDDEEGGVDFVRRRVGMVFQQFNLFPHKCALENVTLGPIRVLGRDPKDVNAEGRGSSSPASAWRRRSTSTPTASPAASSSASRSPGRWRWTRT